MTPAIQKIREAVNGAIDAVWFSRDPIPCLKKALSLLATIEPKIEAGDDISLNDVKGWAEGVLSALGSEYAGRVTDEEVNVACAIRHAQQPAGDVGEAISDLEAGMNSGLFPSRACADICTLIRAATERVEVVTVEAFESWMQENMRTDEETGTLIADDIKTEFPHGLKITDGGEG